MDISRRWEAVPEQRSRPSSAGPVSGQAPWGVVFPSSTQQGHDLPQKVMFGTNCSEEPKQGIEDGFLSRPRMPLLDHASRRLWIPSPVETFSNVACAADSRVWMQQCCRYRYRQTGPDRRKGWDEVQVFFFRKASSETTSPLASPSSCVSALDASPAGRVT